MSIWSWLNDGGPALVKPAANELGSVCSRLLVGMALAALCPLEFGVFQQAACGIKDDG